MSATIINALKLINRFNSSDARWASFHVIDSKLGKYYVVLNDFVFNSEHKSGFRIEQSSQGLTAYGYGVMLSFRDEISQDGEAHSYVTMEKLKTKPTVVESLRKQALEAGYEEW